MLMEMTLLLLTIELKNLFNESKILLLSNRNTGIGFDQLILLEKAAIAVIF